MNILNVGQIGFRYVNRTSESPTAKSVVGSLNEVFIFDEVIAKGYQRE